MPAVAPPGRVVAIGASAGGIEALRRLLGGLPADLDAAVCVILHVPARAPSVLPDILDRAGPLMVKAAVSGDTIAAGHGYVAPPDHHLLIRPGRLELSRGPKENGVRPAVDPTFRSLAGSYGNLGIGVVLSGALDDGSQGIAVLSRAGGTVLVQEPEDALVTGMPRAAIAADTPYRVLPADDLAAVITELCSTTAVREDLPVAAEPDEDEITRRRPAGQPSGLTCPECSGALWEIEDGKVLRYRCRIGHAYAPETLATEQDSAIEAALWSALEALEERAEFMRKLATRVGTLGAGKSRAQYESSAEQAQVRADLLRRVLLGQSNGAP